MAENRADKKARTMGPGAWAGAGALPFKKKLSTKFAPRKMDMSKANFKHFWPRVLTTSAFGLLQVDALGA